MAKLKAGGHNAPCDEVRYLAREHKDLTGQRFGRLTVLYEAPSYREKNTNHLRHKWYCRCECGNEREYRQEVLLYGDTLSCGCYGKELRLQKCRERHSENTFEIKDGYCIVRDNCQREFLIDISDIEKIKERYWYVRKKDGYVYSHNKGTVESNNIKISLHEFLTGEKYVDHINHNPTDNRQCNLRTPNKKQTLTSAQGYNNFNHILRKDNKSGYAGVRYDTKLKKWSASIYFNYKNYNLGYFSNKEDAIQARKEAEEKYFGEYSYDNSQKIASNL